MVVTAALLRSTHGPYRPMDRGLILSYLRTVDEHEANDVQDIADQRDLISTSERTGHNATSAIARLREGRAGTGRAQGKVGALIQNRANHGAAGETRRPFLLRLRKDFLSRRNRPRAPNVRAPIIGAPNLRDETSGASEAGHVLGFFDVILSVRFHGNRYPLWVKAVQKKGSPTNFRHRTARDRLHEAGPSAR